MESCTFAELKEMGKVSQERETQDSLNIKKLEADRPLDVAVQISR